MKKVFSFTLALVCCFFAASSLAQKPFTNCAAAFLNNKIVVDEYTDTGKSSLAKTATGILTVCTANLSPTLSTPVDKIKFKIAIRDKNTGTLTMFADKTFQQVDIQAIMQQCSVGDHIVLITLKNEYALPHNEILVL